MVDGVNQQPGLFQRIGNFFGAGNANAGQRTGTPFFPEDPNAGQPTDPFAGLSRAQRTMLGFAALRDAAASLEGRDSNFFAQSLGGFEQARERERLRAQGIFANQVQALQAIGQIENEIGLLQAQGIQPTPAQLRLRDLLYSSVGDQLPSLANVGRDTAQPAPSGGDMSAEDFQASRAIQPNGSSDISGRPMGTYTGEPEIAIDGGDVEAPPSVSEIDRMRQEVDNFDNQIALVVARGGDPRVLESQRDRLLNEIDTAEAQAAEAAAAQARLETRTPQVVNTLETTQDLREMIEANPGRTTGLVGSILQNVPGTMANDARALGLRIRANLGFDQLQAMREASPTGGALGQVAVQELEALQSTIGNLDLTQTPGQILDQIADIENNYMRLIRRAYETSEDVEALDRALGGRPAFMVENGAASTPRASGAATHRYNPATGQIEAIQ